MQEQVSTAYNLQGQMPLDAKNVVESFEALQAKIDNIPGFIFTLYKGMEIYIQSESEKVVFDLVTQSNLNQILLDKNIIYPSNIVYEGYDYSGKEFNFFYVGSFGNITGNYAPTKLTSNTNPQDYL